MNTSLFTLGVVFIGLVLGVLLRQDPGYVLLAWRHWTMETPLWLFLLGIVILYGFLRTFVSILVWVYSFSGEWKKRREATRSKRAQQKTEDGLLALAQGRFKEAEKWLMQGALEGATPSINYLSAAKAAHALGALDREQRYLSLAKQNPQASLAADLAKANGFLANGDLSAALSLLQSLANEFPRHPMVLKGLHDVYHAKYSWEVIIESQNEWVKHGVLSFEQSEREKEFAHYQRLKNALAIELSLEQCQELWKTIPKKYQRNDKITVAYAHAMLKHGQEKEAASLLKASLKSKWSLHVVRFYAELKGNATQYLTELETYLKTHPLNADLLLTLGQLAQRAQLWGKAQRYYESSVAERQDPQVYGLLGELFLQLGETQKSLAMFQRGFQVYAALREENGN